VLFCEIQDSALLFGSVDLCLLWGERLGASQLISIKNQIWWARLLYPVMGLTLAGLSFL
jgi:hypothetical protein